MNITIVKIDGSKPDHYLPNRPGKFLIDEKVNVWEYIESSDMSGNQWQDLIRRTDLKAEIKIE